MTQILKNHKWAIVLAFLASLIITYPQIYLRYDYQVASQGVELLIGVGDEFAWLSRAREAYDGHPALGNPSFKEGKNDPYVFQPLGSAMIAYLGKLFSLDFNNTILLSRLLFSFLVFLLIYGFVLFFAREKLVALSITLFMFLGNNLFARQSLFSVLQGQAPSLHYLNYIRPVNPLMTSFFFFGFLLCFLLFFEKKQWRWGILSILLLGLSFYDYFYTWTFLYAFLAVLILIFLFQKKWSEIKRTGLVLLGSLLIGIPWLINLYHVTTSVAYPAVSQRFAMADTRLPVLGIVVPAVFLTFLLFFPRKWRDRYPFGLALVIAPFIVLNQQIITGKTMQTMHYHWHYHLPLAIFFLLAIFFFWFSKTNWPIVKKTIAVLIMVVSVFTGIWIQQSSYAVYRGKIADQQRYAWVFDWLNRNGERDEVVFSDEKTNRLIIIYTPLNVFYHTSAKFSLQGTTERLVNSLFLYYRLNGVGQDDVEDIFFKDRVEISYELYGIYYRELLGSYQNIPDVVLLDLAKKYQESLAVDQSVFFKGLLEKYQVQYLVWDKRTYPLWNLDQYRFFEKAVEGGDFAIYQML